MWYLYTRIVPIIGIWWYIRMIDQLITGNNITSLVQCGPPAVISWFITPMSTTIISNINQSYWSYSVIGTDLAIRNQLQPPGKTHMLFGLNHHFPMVFPWFSWGPHWYFVGSTNHWNPRKVPDLEQLQQIAERHAKTAAQASWPTKKTPGSRYVLRLFVAILCIYIIYIYIHTYSYIHIYIHSLCT